jgi:adenylate cyclase
MEKKGFHRKLTAILSADVAGYSRLMQDDEAATVKTLEAYKTAISDLVKQHRGRVVDSPGDNLLADFASVVDAVQCAVATQKELQARNTGLPENRKMQFRIGVNLGDVIEEESRIYGDGVNIAARLESLADPGGICISKTAFDQIETKLPFGYSYLGEQTVKNIARPIGAYKLLMERKVSKRRAISGRNRIVGTAIAAVVLIIGVGIWSYFRPVPRMEPASPEKMALPLPDMPSIAVLPLASIGDDPTTERLSSGIMQNLVNGLSKVPRILVIAATSTAAYKGQTVKVKQVSENLGVQYVLEGSVEKSGDRIRITARLVDALKGHTVWTERYDRELSDVFALQDEITVSILSALRLKEFRLGEQSAIVQKYHKGARGLGCYLKELEVDEHNMSWSLEDNAIALRIAEEAVAECPDDPGAYTAQGNAYHHAAYLGGPTLRSEAIKKSMESAQKALEIDNSLCEPHILLSALYTLKGEHQKALAEAETAVSLNPGNIDALSQYAWTLGFVGRNNEAVPVFEKIIRLNPYAKPTIFRGYGRALINAGRFEEAVAALKKAAQLAPDDKYTRLQLIRAYIKMDKDKEARAEAAEVLRIDPQFSLEAFAKSIPRSAGVDDWINDLRKAGLPEKPSLGQTSKAAQD